MREGELGKEIYFISRGTFEITTNKGKNHVILEDGDYFGNRSYAKRKVHLICKSNDLL